ncbi:Hypothetical predicted protein [Octopus vulgaris]|uniref:Uncharacterized protein n=1 Tax=Octopus vulgaris TaxID=6645 RepID=A0AA36AX68_OCTVU|nr:Hypothetical predicted protein [Octopus vulgaris]
MERNKTQSGETTEENKKEKKKEHEGKNSALKEKENKEKEITVKRQEKGNDSTLKENENKGKNLTEKEQNSQGREAIEKEPKQSQEKGKDSTLKEREKTGKEHKAQGRETTDKELKRQEKEKEKKESKKREREKPREESKEEISSKRKTRENTGLNRWYKFYGTLVQHKCSEEMEELIDRTEGYSWVKMGTKWEETGALIHEDSADAFVETSGKNVLCYVRRVNVPLRNPFSPIPIPPIVQTRTKGSDNGLHSLSNIAEFDTVDISQRLWENVGWKENEADGHFRNKD